MPSIKRIYLLSEAEIVDVYARPDFNQCEKELYFTLDTRELDILNRYSNIRTRVYFILQLGYFKAKQRFFNFNFEDVLTDVEYILSKHSDDSKIILSGQISRNYADQQKKDILELLGYQDWLPKYSLQTEARICELLRYYPKIHSAVRQLLSYFENQNLIAPTYRKLQDMFTAAFSSEEKRLDAIISSTPRRKKKQLADLIARDDGISQLNIIRADQKNFQYTAVRHEVDKAQKISDLYEFAKDFIPKLKLSKNAIRYYADVAEQYPTSRLRRLSKSQQLLHAICFIYHRYQQIMDNLIISFIYHIRSITSDGKIYAETELAKHNANTVADFPQLAQFLKWFPNRDKQLTHEELDKEAYKILPENQFPVLAKFFGGSTFDTKATKWEFYATASRLFSLYLRPVLLVVPFVFYKENNEVMKLIDTLKAHYSKGKTPSTFSLPEDIKNIIPKNMLQYLKRKPTDEQIDPYLFEFFVYQKCFTTSIEEDFVAMIALFIAISNAIWLVKLSLMMLKRLPLNLVILKYQSIATNV